MPQVYGKDMLFSDSTAVLAAQTDTTLNFSGDSIETTNKGTWPNKTFLPGFGGWTINLNAETDFTDAGQQAMETMALNRTTGTVSIAIGGKTYTGSAFITTMDVQGPMKDAVKTNYVLQGSDVLTPAGS